MGKSALYRQGALRFELLFGNGLESSAGSVIIGIDGLGITGVAVHIEYGLALFGIDYVDEAILKSRYYFGGVILAGLGDGNGVVVYTVGHADNVELVPDGLGAAHALLAGFVLLVNGQHPAGFVVVTAVGIANDDVYLLGSGVGEGGAVAGIKGNDVGKIGDLLAVVIGHQPHGRIDITGGRGGLLHRPAGAVKIFPGEGFAVVDLLGQLLAVFGGGGVDQGTIVGYLGAVLLGGVSFAVPVRGVGAVVGQAVAGGGQYNVGIIGIEGIGAAGQPAKIDGAADMASPVAS